MTDNQTTDDSQTTAISTAYKIRGEDDLSDGAGVLGKNTASSGTPIGVEGVVPNNNSGYGLATPDDARIDGELDTNAPFQLNINGNQNIFHGSDADGGEAGNVILGHSSNYTDSGGLSFVLGATIAGGGFDDGDTVEPNAVFDNFGTVSGGKGNQVGTKDGDPTTTTYATVSGGSFNTASGKESTVSGGENNTASGKESTVSGGSFNTASDRGSTVSGGYDNTASGLRSAVPGGSKGAAESDESFVWNDGSGYHEIPNTFVDGLSSDTAVNGEPVTKANTFSVSAQGGVRFITGSGSVTYIHGGSTGWSNTSSRASKTNIDPVDTQDVLNGVDELEVATWEYEDDGGAGTTHIGPMAEEFHDIVDVGASDEHINSLNADGVLFAAVQGLSEKLSEKDDQIDELEEETAELRDRLAVIEEQLDEEDTTEPTPADD